MADLDTLASVIMECSFIPEDELEKLTEPEICSVSPSN